MFGSGEGGSGGGGGTRDAKEDGNGRKWWKRVGCVGLDQQRSTDPRHLIGSVLSLSSPHASENTRNFRVLTLFHHGSVMLPIPATAKNLLLPACPQCCFPMRSNQTHSRLFNGCFGPSAMRKKDVEEPQRQFAIPIPRSSRPSGYCS